MAEAALESLLNKLNDLLLYHSHLITDTPKQIENLDIDLRFFKVFLRELHKKRRKDEHTDVLVQNIRDVVYEAEDVIDAFVTRALERKSFEEKSTSSFSSFRKPSVSLHHIGKKVGEVKEKVEWIRKDFDYRGSDDNYEKPEVRPPRLKDVVGFTDVSDQLIDRLTKETDYLDVVCLTGMFGLGKTTLAWKIFNDPAVLYTFPVRIWLSISQDFSEKDIFLSILKEFTTTTDDIRQKEDKEIARMVSDYLERGSFLIVMDDVWTTEDWDRLRVALPNHNNNGKIMITSRNEEVGKSACYRRAPHQLRFFTQKESWELLQLEAFRNLDCPPALVNIGKLIARDCEGLPLAIVIIGRILLTMYWDSDVNPTRKAWEKVSTQVSKYLILEDPKDRMNNFISLSYDKLPSHLRACLLYLGMFPEDYEIPASRLILMWIGEGFIQQSNDSSLEEIGYKYLEDLINRNLVRISKVKHDGKVKTCWIHDTLRHFCRIKAGNRNENFFQEVKFSDGGFAPPISDMQKYRRLSVHSNCLDFISSKPSDSNCIRSLVCFSEDEFIVSFENTIHIFKAFKLLRVLDIKPIRFHVINRDLFQLVHVRYIALSLDSSTLPSKFSGFWNLQTLIVDTTSKALQVEADIWKLIRLRLFKTNACATLPKPGKYSKHGTELQTLTTISVDNCTAELFELARNLKKLGIRGQLALLLEGKKGSFDCLARMKHLENLKLINDVHPRPASEVPLNGLPQSYQFPSRLKSLSLRATFLKWSNMSILGLLANLEVLKLKDKAFMGNTWEAEEGGFRFLEMLHIEETDLAVWTASSNHYPRLTKLVLRNCRKLIEVPIQLAAIQSFQELQLYSCKSAVASAKDIQEAKKKFQVTPFSIIMNDQS